MKKGKFYLALVIFSLIGQVAWVVENMYFNVFIYKMFGADEQSISAMVMASAVAATVTTLLIGALSDKLGKRKLFICGGYLCWGISICAFALVRMDILQSLVPNAAALGITLVITLDCIMTFFGSSANDACFNAWLTDAADPKSRGAVEGINAMMPLIAILAVFGGFMGLDQSKADSWSLIFCIIGGVVFVIGILGFFLIEEPKLTKSGSDTYFANILYGFRPSVVKSTKPLYLALVAFAIFGISIQIFMPYLILYYEITLQMTDYVLIFAPAIVLAAVFTAFYGRIYDKIGFTKALLPALFLLFAGYMMLFVFQESALVFIGTVLMLCGYLAGSAVFGAVIRDYTPAGKAGRFQGLRIVGQVLIPGVIGPMLGKLVLQGAPQIVNSDGTTSFMPNANIFPAAAVAAIFILPVLLPLSKLLKKEKPYAM